MISIILPTYNRSAIINRTIDCVLNQSYTDYELIIINDCSSDDTEKVIKSYDVLFTGLGGIEGYTCANRAVYIIKNGAIKYVWQAEPNPGVEPDYNELKSNLESI